MYQTNEEELNKKIVKLKSKLKNMSRRSKQLNEENNIDNHVATLMSEIKIKEDAFGVEKNQLTTDNQSLKKKILAMERDLDNLNSKVSCIIIGNSRQNMIFFIHLYICRFISLQSKKLLC